MAKSRLQIDRIRLHLPGRTPEQGRELAQRLADSLPSSLSRDLDGRNLRSGDPGGLTLRVTAAQAADPNGLADALASALADRLQGGSKP